LKKLIYLSVTWWHDFQVNAGFDEMQNAGRYVENSREQQEDAMGPGTIAHADSLAHARSSGDHPPMVP
jgi:hypothetical protein